MIGWCCGDCQFFKDPEVVGHTETMSIHRCGHCEAHNVSTWDDLYCGWHNLPDKWKKVEK